MASKYDQIKDFVLDLGLTILEENTPEELVVVQDDDRGIHHLVIDCEDPIVVLEQLIMKVDAQDKATFYQWLLEQNRQMVHGAFALDQEGQLLLWRDTLQLENLDYNELEGSITALSLAMAELGPELVRFAKNA
jgi:hypothetical protein